MYDLAAPSGRNTEFQELNTLQTTFLEWLFDCLQKYSVFSDQLLLLLQSKIFIPDEYKVCIYVVST